MSLITGCSKGENFGMIPRRVTQCAQGGAHD